MRSTFRSIQCTSVGFGKGAQTAMDHPSPKPNPAKARDEAAAIKKPKGPASMKAAEGSELNRERTA